MASRKSDKDAYAETKMVSVSPGSMERPTLLEERAPSSQRVTQGLDDDDDDTFDELIPGTVVGHFVLERKLGEGGMGVVFLARDPKLQRPVAVKVLRLKKGGTSATHAQQRMLREAQAMAMLSHPNLVTVYEVGKFGKSVFLAMEYVTGRTLEAWLTRHDRLEDVWDVFEQSGRALQAVHDAGLVHRDFKPANVMVTDDGTAKVLDLGIARKVVSDEGGQPGDGSDDAPLSAGRLSALVGPGSASASALDSALTQEGAIIGTPSYMPPEQLLGEPIGPAADQFSFAIALFEALTGHRPFAGNDAIQILTRIVADERAPWPEDSRIPQQLRETIDKALAHEPSDRFGSMGEFLEACQSALGLRGQLRFLTTRWAAHAKNPDYLLPEGARLREGRQLLKELPEALSEDQTEFIVASASLARRRKLGRRALVGGLGILAVGLAPTAWLLERRSRELDAAMRSEINTSIASVRESVETLFTRAEDRILLMYEQREVWLPTVAELVTQGDPGNPVLEQRLLAAIEQLNRFFRPVIERAVTISSLMVARNDGLEYLVFDDPDAGRLSPPYRFYNRLVDTSQLGESAFQVFWPKRGGPPFTGWLHSGEPDSRGQPWTGYNPVTRPWFVNAAKSGQPAVRWTKPYLFFVTKDAGITGSIAWDYRGQRYVLGVDFMLTDISKVTTRLESPNFLALVSTRDGEIVGLPRDARFKSVDDIRRFFVDFDSARRRAKAAGRLADTAAELPTSKDVGIPAITAALEAARATSAGVFAFELEGRRYWAGRGPVGSKEQDLTIYVIQKPR